MEEKYRSKKMQSNCHILNFRGIDLVPPNLNWLQIAVIFLLELDRLKHLHISRSNFAHTQGGGKSVGVSVGGWGKVGPFTQ